LQWAENSGVNLMARTILREKERRQALPPAERGFVVALIQAKPWMAGIKNFFGLKVEKRCEIKSLK